MKKNIYYSEVVVRKNLVKTKTLNLLFALSSLLRIPIEVFLRSNFGERYFSRLLITLFAFVFIATPYYFSQAFGRVNWGLLFENFTTWYIYSFAFIYCSFRRYQEVKRNPSVFDFSKYSQYEGDIREVFLRKKGKDGMANLRAVEIFYEPGAVLLAGILLVLLHQPVGLILVICSLMYSLSYCIAYLIGDHFIMDKIDQMILNEEMEDVFVNDKDPGNAKGVRFYMKKPDDRGFRKKLIDNIIIDDDKHPDDDPNAPMVAS